MSKLEFYIANINLQYWPQYKVKCWNISNRISLPPWALVLKRALTLHQTHSHKVRCIGSIMASSPKHEDMQGMQWKPSGGWITYLLHTQCIRSFVREMMNCYSNVSYLNVHQKCWTHICMHYSHIESFYFIVTPFLRKETHTRLYVDLIP